MERYNRLNGKEYFSEHCISPKNIYLCLNTRKQKTMEALNRYLPLLADYMQKHANTYHISRMGIFGSIARGEETETSDVDVCFEGEAPSLFTMARIKRELEELFGRTVDLVRLRERMDEMLKQNIRKEAVYV